MDKDILESLLSREEFLYRCLGWLYARQTLDEQVSEQTRYRNDIGFTGADAPILTKFARLVEKGYKLSPKQQVYCRDLLLKYHRQIEEELEGLGRRLEEKLANINS